MKISSILPKVYWKILIWNYTIRLKNIYLLREYCDGSWKIYFTGKKIWNSYQENKTRKELQNYILEKKKWGCNPPKTVLKVWDLENWFNLIQINSKVL